jgi:sulfite exporter TauE/SafE
VLALAGSVLVTSLIGSPHCAAMCGGFVVFYAGGHSRRRWLAHTAYNLGRLLSYVVLGVLAGALGAGVERIGALAGVARAAAWLAGTAMIVWGGAALLRALGAARPVRAGRRGAHALIAPALRAVHAQPAEVRGLAMGLLSTLLPCGWLYAYVAIAAGTGTPLGGASVMAVFWLGTVPVMAGLALFAQSALGGLRRRLPVAAALIMIALGLMTLGGKLRPHAHDAGHAGHAAAKVETRDARVAPAKAAAGAARSGEASGSHDHD